MKQNFEWVDDFKEGFAKVQLLDNTYNFIDRHGNLLSKQNFKWVYDFQDDFARVKLSDGTYNLLDRHGNLLSKQNFKWVGDFEDGFTIVQLLNGTWYCIDKDLNFYDYESKTPVSTLFNETLARLNKFYGVELKLKSNLENIDLNE